MSNLIPNGWKSKLIGDFNFDISDGNYSSKYPKQSEFISSGIPFIRSNNLKNQTVISFDMRFISPELHADLKKGHLKNGDILISTRGNIGQVAKVPNSFVGSNINAQLVRINTKNKLHDEYLLQFLLFDATQGAIKDLETGTALKQLPVGKLKQLNIVYPPLPEQQKIAKILTSVDEVIEKTQAQIDKLKDLKTGMMQELLTKGIGPGGVPHTEFKDSPVGRIPVGWEVVTLGDVTIESAFGPRFSSDEYASNGNFGCIRTTDMDENWDINYSTAPLARLNFKEFEKHILVDGDLLVTRSGTCGLVDVFREQSKPMVAAAFLIRFRLTDKVIPLFIKYLMMSTHIQESVQLLASGGVQKNLSGTSLKTLKIPKPTIQEQVKIVKAIESINNHLATSNKKLLQNKNLKKALMQDLLTGKVRVKINKESAIN